MSEHRGLKRFIFFLITLAVFWAVANLIPLKKNYQNNPFITDGLPMIAAHRGGADNNPENTMLAFREAVNTVGVDIIECDVQLTKDGFLVFCHDDYIDKDCNINGDASPSEVDRLCENESNRHYVKDMTLDELKQYNFGYYFENEYGERIYKESADIFAMGLSIVTPEELFDEFYETYPDLKFIIEIKNEGDLGKEAADKLCNILERYPNYKKNTVIGSFHPVIGGYISKNHSSFYRGSTITENVFFALTTRLFLAGLNRSGSACLQIPLDYKAADIEFTLTTERVVKIAHERGIAVQCWTINDPEEMRKLIEMGVDCIMTDNPKLLKKIIEEYKQ